MATRFCAVLYGGDLVLYAYENYDVRTQSESQIINLNKRVFSFSFMIVDKVELWRPFVCLGLGPHTGRDPHAHRAAGGIEARRGRPNREARPTGYSVYI